MSAGAGAPAVFRQNLGPACPVPTYRSLDAGTVTVQGPGFGLTQAAIRQFSPPEGNPIIELTEYHADLSRGAIRPGSFDVTATGGSDVGAFRTSLRVGAGVNITTPLVAGTVLNREVPIVVRWDGGDLGAWVTMKLVVQRGSYRQFVVARAPASEASIAIAPTYLTEIPAGPVEIDIKVTPMAASALVAPDLTLGGENTWKYGYRFSGLKKGGNSSGYRCRPDSLRIVVRANPASPQARRSLIPCCWMAVAPLELLGRRSRPSRRNFAF